MLSASIGSASSASPDLRSTAATSARQSSSLAAGKSAANSRSGSRRSVEAGILRIVGRCGRPWPAQVAQLTPGRPAGGPSTSHRSFCRSTQADGGTFLAWPGVAPVWTRHRCRTRCGAARSIAASAWPSAPCACSRCSPGASVASESRRTTAATCSRPRPSVTTSWAPTHATASTPCPPSGPRCRPRTPDWAATEVTSRQHQQRAVDTVRTRGPPATA